MDIKSLFHLGKYELLKKRIRSKPETALRKSSLGKEKERTFSVPRESGQRNYLHYSHPLEKYLFGRLELTAPIRLCLSTWVFPV